MPHQNQNLLDVPRVVTGLVDVCGLHVVISSMSNIVSSFAQFHKP